MEMEAPRYRVLRISLLTSLETGSDLDFAMGPFMAKGSGELNLARELLDSLNTGDVLVGDAFYMNYSFISLVKERGIDFVSIRKKNAKFIEISSQRISAEDRIITIQRAKRRDNHFSWIEKDEYEKMPETLKLRETTVTLKLNGFRTKRITLVSTLLNYEAYTALDLAELFFAHWNIETDLRNIKRILNIDFLKSKTPEMVRKECWTDLLAYILIRRVMVRMGSYLGIKARSLSFKQSVVFLEAFLSKVSGALDRYYLWKDCAALLGAFAIKKRPERFEPRAIKNRRGSNSYPDFEVTRS
ncbi:MAG: IS4/IS5 family transposase [Proteobacteria bacterium]|nr:MAG: IS4/IS5 family transposase [Pseudomonadota bacterium]